MTPLSRRLLRLILNIWLHRLTAPGKFIVIGAFFASSLGSISLAIPIYHLSTAFAGVLCVSLLSFYLVRRRLWIHGDFPEKASAGQPFTAEFTVEHRGRFGVYDVGLSFFFLPESLRQIDGDVTVPYLKGGESVSLPVTIQPLKRGYFELPQLTAYSTFPFNLWRKRVVRRPPAGLMVLSSRAAA